jgi:PAS domain S-box-containing protein
MLSLRLKLLGLVAGTSVAAAILTSAAAVRSQLQSGYVQLERSAAGAASGATAALVDPLAKHDREAIREALVEQTKRVGASRATVRAEDLTVSVAAAPSKSAPEKAADSWIGTASHYLVSAVAWTTRPPSVSIPISSAPSGPAGTVRFDLDPAAAHADSIRSVTAALVVGLSVVSLAVIVGFVGIGRITVPLGKLRNVASAIAHGDLSKRLPSDGEPEVEALCRTFNEMTDILASHSSTARFLSGVMDSMADALVVVDTQAKVLSVNRATVALLGYTETELKGRTASVFWEADGQALTATQLAPLLAGGAKEDHEVSFIAKDGRHIPISFSGSPIKDEAGAVTGYVCIGTDISARRTAETERDKMNKQLLVSSREAGMAVVATGVLHNVGNVLNSVNISASMVESGLKRSKVQSLVELAQLVDQHKQDLAGFLTSDQRGRVIPDYLGKLANTMASEQERLLAEISSLSRHVSHIKDIISVQQSTATAAGLVEPTNICTAIEDAILVIMPSATRHHAQIVRNFSDVPAVVTDKHKLLQIIVNLLSNAIDAVKPVAVIRAGSIRISVRPSGESHIVIDVSDNGVGIAPENLTRIFAHGFTTKKGGHGFGLHSSALAAAELKGSLNVRSDGPQTGATFTLTLPISVNAESTADASATESSQAKGPSSPAPAASIEPRKARGAAA